jgi:hypothetical protein
MHPPGVEPEPIAWKAIILPLDQECFDGSELMKYNYIPDNNHEPSCICASRGVFVTPMWISVHVLCEYSVPASNVRPSNRIPNSTISALYTKRITFTLHRLAGLHIHTVFIYHHTTVLSLTTAASVSSY